MIVRGDPEDELGVIRRYNNGGKEKKGLDLLTGSDKMGSLKVCPCNAFSMVSVHMMGDDLVNHLVSDFVDVPGCCNVSARIVGDIDCQIRGSGGNHCEVGDASNMVRYSGEEGLSCLRKQVVGLNRQSCRAKWVQVALGQ